MSDRKEIQRDFSTSQDISDCDNGVAEDLSLLKRDAV